MTINVRGIKSNLDSLESYFKANDIPIAGRGAKVCGGGGGLWGAATPPPPSLKKKLFLFDHIVIESTSN